MINTVLKTRRIFFALILGAPAAASADGPTPSGTTGLLATPTAEIQLTGTLRTGWARQDFGSTGAEPLQNYFLTVGFLPGLEVGGRIVEDNFGYPEFSGRRDLSFNAKVRLDLPAGIGIAVGGEDIGGEQQFFRTRYAVATLPWHSLRFSAGYGLGPYLLDGAFGGIEWRPWEFIGIFGEHDTEDFNGGVKLASPALIYGLRIGATAAYRGVNEDVEYGANLEIPLGRSERPYAPSPGAQGAPASPTSTQSAETPPSPAPAARPLPPGGGRGENEALRAALTRHGFESLRIGRRGTTQVVALENRVYNHSSADAIGLALAAIATYADPAVEHIELTLFAYGLPQVSVTAPAALYRAFLADPAAHDAELRQALAVRPVSGIEEGVAWDSERYSSLNGMELVIEPLLRSFIATEFGLVDYSLGARMRLTLPMSGGFLMHLGGQVPLVESDDYGPGDNFESTGVEAGLDLLLAQYAHKLSPQWTWLWSAGRSQIFQTDLNTLGLEQLWLSEQGTHQLRGKMMALHSATKTRTVALAGYTWFDPARDYSVGLTGGRFYSEDSGFRLDVSRYFGDTIVTLFFKAASMDDQAGGLQLSLPLTPRRDMTPRGLQVKGSRRWSHQQSTTLNTADGANTLKPLFLFEPMLDLDLRRDFHDSGRLGEGYIRDEVPRMHEAYRAWGETAPSP